MIHIDVKNSFDIFSLFFFLLKKGIGRLLHSKHRLFACTCCTISEVLAFDNRIWITSHPSWTRKAELGIESKPQRFQFASSNMCFHLLAAFMTTSTSKGEIDRASQFSSLSRNAPVTANEKDRDGKRKREKERVTVIRRVSGSEVKS